MSEAILNATVVDRVDVTQELIRLFVKPDVPFKAFLPGQYVALGLPGSAPRPPSYPKEEKVHESDKLIKRAYSIGSTPNSIEVLEFYIALLPQGALTARLAALKPGDRIFAANKITGTFTLDGVGPDQNLVLVATGTGLAPFISMLRTQSTWTPSRSITVIHGVRYEQDLAYADELLALAEDRSDFRYLTIVSRASAGWKGARGHVTRFFKEGDVALSPLRDHVYLCGNPAMIDDMEKFLCAMGYTVHSKKNPGALHLEKYW